jgi:hypothetical protein
VWAGSEALAVHRLYWLRAAAIMEDGRQNNSAWKMTGKEWILIKDKLNVYDSALLE